MPPPVLASRPAEPFATAEEAWFWAIDSLEARATGVRGSRSGVHRPCDPDDILRCLDRLYRQRLIEARHAGVLRRWGIQRLRPGSAHYHGADAALWDEALSRLSPLLEAKGVVRKIGKKS